MYSTPWHRRDELEIEFAAQSLLHDLHVKEPEEPGAESEPKSGRRLGLVIERRVVELELLERIAQRLVLRRVGRIETSKDEG